MSDIETATVRVLMSPELMEQWASRDAEGRRLTWSWGEPDADGFHTPTITTHDDDRLGELDAAWAEVEAALPDPAWLVSVGSIFDHKARKVYWAGAGPVPEDQETLLGGKDSPAAALRALAAKLREPRP